MHTSQVFRRAGLICLVTLFLLVSLPIFGAGPSGRQIMEEQEKRHKLRSQYTEELMILVDSKGNREQRKLRRYGKEMGDKLRRGLLVFDAPAGIKGTALLTWEQDKRDNDQWLFLPAQRRMQRIAKGSKKAYFMGTDFTYEDLEPEDIDNFNYKVLKEERVDGKACWVIESVPANADTKKNSGYSKRMLWVRKDNYYTVKIQFFDRRNKLIKTQTNSSLVQVKGTAWRADKSLMDNHKSRHKTLVGIKSRRIDVKIDDSMFTERFVQSGKHIR